MFRVLLVDDEPLILEHTRRLLETEKQNYLIVETADNGLDGINAGSNGLCMAVNEKLVTDAGMEVPSNEMTWEEFEKWAIEFHEKTGKVARICSA